MDKQKQKADVIKKGKYMENMAMSVKNEQRLGRAAGILLPVSSLPSKYGIGTFGDEAYEFVDALVEAGQKFWQVLPLGPTSYGDSPYQSFSAFAGNPYFIDLDYLVKEGLITEEQILAKSWGNNPEDIDYATIFNNRFDLLKEAYHNSNFRETKEYQAFAENSTYWLDDYSFYMALKGQFNNQSWTEWDEDIKFRQEEAVAKYREELADEIDFWKFCQFKFYEQWGKLKEYANEKGVQIIGDIPLYVSMDSSDVWVHGRLFELDERKNPINVAGVPPDCFSETGQRWGNPLYDWNAMEKEDFSWWRERMKANATLYDVIRIDHFIGVVRYYRIPSSCETAMEGRWKKGPGIKLTTAIKESIGDAKIIAEDLGVVVPSVVELMEEMGWPGMKIMQFAFDGTTTNNNLPHTYRNNMLVYGGTHDNETLVGFFEPKTEEEMEYTYKYLNVTTKAEVPKAIIRSSYASVADVVIMQMQDILELDNSARMNLPSSVGQNWRWRMTKGQFTEEHIAYLKELTEIYNRDGKVSEEEPVSEDDTEE